MRHHEEPGREVEPRIEVLGEHVLREGERHETEREDADRVGDRDGGAEDHGMARAAAGADQIGGHHGLAMAGRERVKRSPSEGGEEQQQENALAGGGALEEAFEAALLAAFACGDEGAALAARRDKRAVTRADGEGGVAAVERAGEKVVGVAPEAVGGIAARNVRANGGALTGSGDDGAPADAVLEGVVAKAHGAGRVHGGGQPELEARGGKAAAAGREGGVGSDPPPAAWSASRRRSAPGPGGPRPLPLEHFLRREPPLLHRRDLRLVE